MFRYLILRSLDNPTPKKMMITSFIGIFVSMMIYLIIGITAYVTYGRTIKDSILDVDNASVIIVILENIAFIFTSIMNFPLGFAAFKNYVFFLIELIISMLSKCVIIHI